MANQADVTNPAPGNVPANAPIANIKVQASGTSDVVDPGSSDVGTVTGGVYSPQAGLQATSTADIYEPDSQVLAPSGKFKIRANVQFTGGGMPTQNLPASHAGEFDGQAHGKTSQGRPKPKSGRERRGTKKKPAARAAKPAARGAKKSLRKKVKPAAAVKRRAGATKTSSAKKGRKAAKGKSAGRKKKK